MDELCVCTSHQACLAILFKDAVGNPAVLVAVDITLTSGLFRKSLVVVAKHGVKFVTSGHDYPPCLRPVYAVGNVGLL